MLEEVIHRKEFDFLLLRPTKEQAKSGLILPAIYIAKLLKNFC